MPTLKTNDTYKIDYSKIDFSKIEYNSNFYILEKIVLNLLTDKDFFNYFIKDKNLVEKRKFLSLLLLVSTNITLNELIYLKVNDFMKIIDNLNNDLNNYKEFEINDEEEKKEEYYLTLKVDSYGKDLNLNLAFKEFFKEDLYKDMIENKENMDPVLSSIISHKRLSTVNLRKDINEQIVELLYIQQNNKLFNNLLFY